MSTKVDSPFRAEVLENEVVMAHVTEGHIYHFPILPNDTVSLHGARIESNPASQRKASRFVFDAHNAARVAYGRSNA